MSLEKIFTQKREFFDFQGTRLPVWHWKYWLTQAPLIGIPYDHYYDVFAELGWEHVPKDKPIIFAISHKNAFMDSLAFVNLHDTQVWQLARGDAFKKPLMRKLFYFFHMLPIWRERDGVDTKTANNDTFKACHDILFHNGMIGIYPEGDCINERHIRPLKKGICRIAFGAMDSYDWNMDLSIVPVGISYNGAEKFKKWQLVHFGKPIHISDYKVMYANSQSLAVAKLRDKLQVRLQELVVHIPKSNFHHTIDIASQIVARENILNSKREYEPVSCLNEEQRLVQVLENIRLHDIERMQQIADSTEAYVKARDAFNFRENTFSADRRSFLYLLSGALFLQLFLPVFIIGAVMNWLPFKIPHWYVRKKIKQKIFNSSLQYAFGLISFIVFYLLYLIVFWIVSGSFQVAIALLFAMPFFGNFAFYYWRFYKRWTSAIRLFSLSGKQEIQQMLSDRKKLIDLTMKG